MHRPNCIHMMAVLNCTRSTVCKSAWGTWRSGREAKLASSLRRGMTMPSAMLSPMPPRSCCTKSMKHAMCVIFILTCLLALNVSAFAPVLTGRSGALPTHSYLSSSANDDEEYDVVVIGAGIGGLSCAALCARYGLKTICLEAHDTAGGVAHSFTRYSTASKTTPFCFDSGPSLITGLSQKGTNPLRQVLDAVGVADDIEWRTYDGWVVHDLGDHRSFKLTTGNGGKFEQALEEKAGKQSRQAFEAFKNQLLGPKGLSEASSYLPPFALRGGPRAVLSLAKYTLKLLSIGSKGNFLTGPFTNIMDYYNVRLVTVVVMLVD